MASKPEMSKESPFLLVLSTCPDAALAKSIARELVEDKLAACVNIIADVNSCFSWAGKTDTALEHLLLIKTREACYPTLERRVKALHPYELPEIIAVPIHTGLPAYLDWISNSTRSA